MDLPQVLNGLERIRIHNHKVRKFSRLYATQQIVLCQRLGGRGSRGPQRFEGAEPGSGQHSISRCSANPGTSTPIPGPSVPAMMRTPASPHIPTNFCSFWNASWAARTSYGGVSKTPAFQYLSAPSPSDLGKYWL
jgi:hypothetical protein